MKAAEVPWHAAYPAPRKASPTGMTPSQVLDLLQKADGGGEKKEVVLVDLRRADHEGGTIRGSINLPAQSLYPTIPTLYNIFRAAGVRTVIWYCASSKGRGNRAAGWFSDYLEDHEDRNMESLVLLGGIKGWVATGEAFTNYMDEYDPDKWDQK